MSEEERIVKSVKELLLALEDKTVRMNGKNLVNFLVGEEDYKDIQGLLDLYQKEEEKNNNLIHELRIYQNETISKNKIREKIKEYHHKDFIKVQVCHQHDNEARIKEEALKELLEERN